MQIEISSRCQQLQADCNCHSSFPRYLLSRLARYLWTADSQFGFKQAHGTEMAIYALKQTVDFYLNQDTPVYMCFFDAKKVFDGVNHWTLAKKLLDRNVPLHIVKLFLLV